jgi:GMP synthase PP-ATPase subunit
LIIDNFISTLRHFDNLFQHFISTLDNFISKGTLRPDLIESASEIASKCADVIKTHHNDTLLVRQLRDLVTNGICSFFSMQNLGTSN